jgi:3-methyl-2-oxobutanoate hydroxymethyltransferase
MPVLIPSKGADMKKITIPSFRQKKKDAQKVTMITVYDYVFARLVEASDAEMILVGDSLGMVIRRMSGAAPPIPWSSGTCPS